MVNRNVSTHVAFLALGAFLGVACSVYTPTFKDCTVSCSEDGKCPEGTVCNDTYCRPAGFKGACTCEPGSSEACGGSGGECKAGVRLCLESRYWGPCLGEVKASQEVCDGKDNDCDGVTDEDPYDAPLCPLNKGVCAFTVQRCVDAGYSGTCDVSAYGGDYEASEQTCDGLDNDCDGVADSRPPVRMATDVAKWAVAPIVGGFYLFTTRAGVNSITAQYFNEQLVPQDAPQTIATGGEVQRLKVAGNAGTAVVGWTRTDNVLGMSMVKRTELPEAITTGVAGTTASWSVGVTSDGGVVAAFERDGGISIHRWEGGGSPVSTVPLALVSPTDSIDLLTLTNNGTVIAWDGERASTDGGSTEYPGGIQRLDGTRSVTHTSFADAVLVETPTALQSIDGFSTYFFFFPLSIDESGMSVCFDAWRGSAAASTVARANDHKRYKSAAATAVGNDVVVGWIDYAALYVGTTLPSVQQVRAKYIGLDAGTVADYDLSSAIGSGLVGLFFRTQSDPTTVYAMSMCPP